MHGAIIIAIAVVVHYIEQVFGHFSSSLGRRFDTGNVISRIFPIQNMKEWHRNDFGSRNSDISVLEEESVHRANSGGICEISTFARKSVQSLQSYTYDVASVKARRIINCNFVGLALYPNNPSAGPAHEAVAVSSG